MPDFWRPRHVLHVFTQLTVALALYAAALAYMRIGDLPILPSRFNRLYAIQVGDKKAPALVDYTDPEVIGGLDDNPIQIKFAALPYPVRFNRFANFYNRPSTRVEPRDDYLGPRPHVDTEIDYEALMRGCRGNLDTLPQYKNTSNCLEFLKNREDVYTALPPPKFRASDQDPRRAEYLNADGHNNTRSSYVSLQDAAQATNTTRGACPGPIIPYHVYWRGPATWRVELFIKAYLYTQNLPCSQLHLWLDSDPFPNAVADMLHKDRLFKRFLPMVERGDIVVRAWHFPSQIPLPASTPLARRRADPFGPLLGRQQSAAGQLTLSQKEKSFLPVAVSDAVRFIVLHLYGGGYFDMDVVMLRDMRPFYLPRNHSFAERWSTYTNGGFNTAIMSLTANSSLSSYYLQGGVKMGMNFHPLILGIMSQKEGRNHELQMLEHGVFDPLWGRYAGAEDGPCPVPCFHGDYSKAFKGGRQAIPDEWQSYTGPQLKELHLGRPPRNTWKTGRLPEPPPDEQKPPTKKPRLKRDRQAGTPLRPDTPGGHLHRRSDMLDRGSVFEEFLTNSEIVSEYRPHLDPWPPTNRTLENFFRGAYTYHVHNQWNAKPEPNSWLSVIERAHDRFFDGSSPNPYGEMWTGPYIPRYPTWAEFL